MMAHVCDKCMNNRSDQVEMYHLTLTKIEQNGKMATRIIKEIDICAPCLDKMMGGQK